MMNNLGLKQMINLDLKEIVGVKFKDGICAVAIVFKGLVKVKVILLIQDGFENDCPDNHFVKSVQKKPCADVFHNRCVAKILQQENTCVGVSF